MGGGLRLLTWLLKRRAPLRKPRANNQAGGSHLTAPVWIWGAQAQVAPCAAGIGPSPSQAAKPRAPKARFHCGDSKRPDPERQKETFPVWHRAPRAQGIYSSASSTGAASPSAAASAAEPLPRAGQKEEPCDFGGAGSQQRGSNALCSLCRTPSPPSP